MQKFKVWLPFFLGLVVSASLLWPLFFAPYFTHHDDVQVIRTHQMVKCILDNQIPCRWVPDLGGLYGYPLFNYYAPLPYYISAGFYFLTGSFIISAKLLFGTAFLLSYVFMFLLGRKLWGNWGGFISGVLYAYAPYHANDLYVRGAMGELWGLVFFPAVLWGVLLLYSKQSIKNLIFLSLFFALLVLSHNLSAMIFIAVVLGLVLFLCFFGELKKRKERLLFSGFVGAGIGLGLLLAGFYWIPVVMEKGLVHVETTTYGYFFYTEHFKGLRKLFLDTSWGWGASIREIPGGEKDGMSFQIGLVHLFFWAFALFGAFILRKKDAFSSKLILLFTFFSIGAVFMIHPRSEFIWKLIEDQLRYLQFPWRFLMLVILFISIIGGFIPKFIETQFPNMFRTENRKIWLIVFLVIPIILYNFSYFRPEKFIQTTDQKLLSGQDWDKQIKRSIYDYLPKSAHEPPAELATSRYQVLTEAPITVKEFYEGTDWFTMNVQTSGHTIIRFSQYYFPGWKITVNGEPVQIDSNNNLGLMTIILGQGDYKIEARLHNTMPRTLGNFLTLLGVGIVFVLFILSNKKMRKGLRYYMGSLNR